MSATTTQPFAPTITIPRRSPAAWLATVFASASFSLLAALHVLSPEFHPSWRMVSEYAFGHYDWVLSLMFLCWGLSTWSLVFAIRPFVLTSTGRLGVLLLAIAGLGQAMASVFDVTHPIGHGVAGLLGVVGFPIAALLLAADMGRREGWRRLRKPLLWIAHLNWTSIVLLIATLTLMTMQMAHANGGHLPRHAPKSLPAGVIALDGWADRLIIVTNYAWLLLAACGIRRMSRRQG